MLLKQRSIPLNSTSACVILLLLLLISTAQSQDGAWIIKQPMPLEGRCLTASCELDGKIYVMGGQSNSTYPSATKTVQIFDPETNTWSESIKLPSPRSGPAACAFNGKIYLMGGRTGDFSNAYQNTVYEFDPVTQEWTEKADMPTKKGFFRALAVDDKIYTIGGRGNNDVDPLDIEVYDPAADTWSKKAPMPVNRNLYAMSMVNNKIYVFGGERGFNKTGTRSVFEYDIIKDEWDQKGDMATARLGMTATAVNGKIYVQGGLKYFPTSNPSLTLNEEYDPATDTWRSLADLPVPKGCHCGAVVEDKIYLIGGITVFGSVPFDSLTTSVEEFSAITGVEEFSSQNKPVTFDLFQNYPNPFNPTTTISYSLADNSFVKLTVYNILGQVMSVLVNEYQLAGSYSVVWDAGHLPGGLFFCGLEADGFSTFKKMVLQK